MYVCLAQENEGHLVPFLLKPMDYPDSADERIRTRPGSTMASRPGKRIIRQDERIRTRPGSTMASRPGKRVSTSYE